MDLNGDGQKKETGTESLPAHRHALTEENSPEETMRRMRLLPERVARLREQLRVTREANTR